MGRPEFYDFAVVGAGPAGARAAELFARRGASVLLLDPKAPWEKPCGGGLTAAALRHTPELRELAAETITVRELVVVAPRGARVVVALREPYEVVSRITLARWGLERAQAAGARFLPGAAHQVSWQADGWRLSDSRGGEHRARWLVAADGATSRLRGLLAPELRPELAPTRVAYPRFPSEKGRAVFAFLPAADGYLWDFPRSDHHSIGIGVAPGSFPRAPLDQAIEQYGFGEIGERRAAEYRGAVIATSAWQSGRFRDLGDRRFALLGDAAGLADPATGEGIDYALRSATAAVESFHPDRGFEDYPAAVERAFGVEFRRAKLIRRWLYRPGVADLLVRQAGRSARWAGLLTALTDAINEHGSLRAALVRGLGTRVSASGRPEPACECVVVSRTTPSPRSSDDSDPFCPNCEEVQGAEAGRGPAVERIELPIGELAPPGAKELAARLEPTPGVYAAIASPVTERAVVGFDPEKSSVPAIIAAVEEHGIEVEGSMVRWRIGMPGLKCPRCARRIERMIGDVAGVHNAAVNLATETLSIEYVPGRTDLAALRGALGSRPSAPGPDGRWGERPPDLNLGQGCSRMPPDRPETRSTHPSRNYQ